MTNPPLSIPILYKLQFTILDPLISAFTAYYDLTNPDYMLTALIPNSTRNPLHDPLFHHHAAFMLCIAFLGAVLLRTTRELSTWKVLQAAILIADLVLCWSCYASLAFQGRVHPSLWRGEDWGSVGLTVWVAVLRALFVAGVGLESANASAGGQDRRVKFA